MKRSFPAASRRDAGNNIFAAKTPPTTLEEPCRFISSLLDLCGILPLRGGFERVLVGLVETRRLTCLSLFSSLYFCG